MTENDLQEKLKNKRRLDDILEHLVHIDTELKKAKSKKKRETLLQQHFEWEDALKRYGWSDLLY